MAVKQSPVLSMLRKQLVLRLAADQLAATRDDRSDKFRRGIELHDLNGCPANGGECAYVREAMEVLGVDADAVKTWPADLELPALGVR